MGGGFSGILELSARNFPSRFLMGNYQGVLNSSTIEIFNNQALHIAYIVEEALDRDLVVVASALAR